MNHLIRWKKGDYIKLGKAISNYNKTISKVDNITNNSLPGKLNYNSIKENIKSRKELNRLIKSYKRINESNLKESVVLGDEKITKYEYHEIKNERKRALQRLTREKNKILKSDGVGIGMQNKRLQELDSSIESIKNLENKNKENIMLTLKRISKLASADYNLIKAETYRDNFMESLKSLENFDNYDVLKKKLENIKNPIEFYKYVSNSEILKDLFIYYKDLSSVYGSFNSNEEAFNYALKEDLHLIQ